MRIRNLLLAAAVLALLGVSLAWTYTLQYGNGHYLRWANKATDKTNVTMNISLAFPTQSNFNSPNIVQAVVDKVMGEWNSTLAANGIAVTYVDAGSTSVHDVGCDGVNVITFTNTNISQPAYILPSGVLAISILESLPVQPAYPVTVSGCGTTNPTVSFPEQIVDADIEFNVLLPVSTDGQYVNGAIATDFEGTLLHEMGHVLGLHHTGIIGSLMVPRSQQAFPSRGLSTDEIAGINAAYGVNTLGGAISGTVTDSTGAAVLAAEVVLVDSKTGFPTVSALTDKSGNYTIVGFAPGTYKVYVEPMDGPANLTDFPSELYANGNNKFATTFVATPVTVAKGTPTTGFNITVPSVGSANSLTLNVGLISGFNTSTLGGGAVISAPRGNTVLLCLGGTGLTGDITTSEPNGKVVATTTTGTNPGCSNNLGRTFSIAPDTPVGFYDVYAGNAAQSGALYISTNPSAGAGGLVDGAAFGQSSGTAQIAQGSIISIFGLDLTTAITPESGFPVPTQLGGVSVRIGDRWAPLYIATPGQINAMVPYEIPAGTAAVQIEAGNNSVFKYGNINVGASAPRIFTIPSGGSGQGAIQDGSNGYVIVNSSAPASAGHVLVIYCEGLGQTNPPAPSGIAANGAPQIAALPSVNIGGQNSSVQFAGISPGFTGLYQVNAVVPSGLGVNNALPLYITDASGNRSNTVTIAVH
jgi:uncharacterized protein (TIGR03437 family)